MPSQRTNISVCGPMLIALLTSASEASIVFSRAPGPSGGLVVSSWVDPDGSDSDMYAYDSLIVGYNATITEVHWRGGYTQGAFGGHVTNFTVTFFDSIPGGSQPHLGNPQLEDTVPTYLAKYWVGSNAGETFFGTVGGTSMYDYAFILPTPFLATAGTKYWLRIEGSQNTYPDWGIAVGTFDDGRYFRFSTGLAMFQFIPQGDTAFTLLNALPTYTITTSASPISGGSITGAGDYSSGAPVSLTATPSPGYAFLSWKENGVQVSTSAVYNFTASANRTLVANFAPVVPALSGLGVAVDRKSVV